MILLFAFTAFLSAALMFVVQPLTGKMLLPALGGAPAVWNTCLVFFQTALLLGYLYAHLSTRCLGVRRQALLHVGVLLLPLAVLPIRLSERALERLPHATSPVPWLLGFLAISVGLPFFAVSATAPLLQKWLAGTPHRHARDPYFLYAASNAGSVLGLLAYPVAIEPLLRLHRQSEWWRIGYIALAFCLAICALTLRRVIAPADVNPAGITPLSWRRRGRWVLLAAVPSSLLMGVTTYLTTDVSPLPLFWVVPLALYLTTFILVFARRPILAPAWGNRVLCLPALVLVVAFIVQANHPPWLLVPLHLLVFFAAAMICHTELAKDRPEAAHLTEFYLCLSVGGALGGMFNALVAPHIFSSVLEYPLVMILACAIQPDTSSQRRADCTWGAAAFGATAGLILALQRMNLSTVWIFGVPALLAYRWVQQPRRFGLMLVGMLAAGIWYVPAQGRTLLAERNFFGVLRVTMDSAGQYHQLVHSNTIHGRESLAHKGEPLVYYHRSGPLGQVIAAYNVAPTSPRVAVIGLGAGSMASYIAPTQDWTFYEIDPAVEQIARDPECFTFLSDRNFRVLLGDARLRLREAPARQYGLIVLDAFSSDSIPTHLLTREAVQLYLAKLANRGQLAFHITNRRLDLLPVVANLAADAGLAAFTRYDREQGDGKEPSQWVALARRREDLGVLASDPRWDPLPADRNFGVWTDDFSNILAVLKWR